MKPKSHSFEDLLDSAKRSAVHLEMRDAYLVNRESEEFKSWQETGERTATESARAYWKPWTDLISRTVERGVTVRRLRIVSEPLSEYARYGHAGAHWNIEAGEDVRYLRRRHTVDLAFPGADFWLIDDELVRFNLFSGDNAPVDPDFSEEPDVVRLCASSFESAWSRAVPHAGFAL